MSPPVSFSWPGSCQASLGVRRHKDVTLISPGRSLFTRPSCYLMSDRVLQNVLDKSSRQRFAMNAYFNQAFLWDTSFSPAAIRLCLFSVVSLFACDFKSLTKTSLCGFGILENEDNLILISEIWVGNHRSGGVTRNIIGAIKLTPSCDYLSPPRPHHWMGWETSKWIYYL